MKLFLLGHAHRRERAPEPGGGSLPRDRVDAARPARQAGRPAVVTFR